MLLSLFTFSRIVPRSQRLFQGSNFVQGHACECSGLEISLWISWPLDQNGIWMQVVLFSMAHAMFQPGNKVKRLVRLFRRTCAIESVFWKTPCRLFLPSLPNLVQCSSINCIGKENSSDLASSFTRMLPHLRTSLLHRYIIGRNRTPWFANNIGAIQSSPISSGLE
jgi:hypothetical protein